MSSDSNKKKIELIREFWGKIDSINGKGRELENLSIPELTTLNILTGIVDNFISEPKKK